MRYVTRPLVRWSMLTLVLALVAITIVPFFRHSQPHINEPDFPAQTAARYESLVSVHWVKRLLDHDRAPSSVERPNTYRANRFVVVEASWGTLNAVDDYLAGHVPGAIHLNTDDLETGYPEWKLRDPVRLQQLLGQKGISPDAMIIVYGDKLITAARVWWILKYVGVQDVRIMDGGLTRWRSAGYPTETKLGELEPVEFSSDVRSDWLATTEQVRMAIDSTDAILADVRSQEEFEGLASGYRYLDAKGRIPQSVHLGDADDSASLYLQPDGRLRAPGEILSGWETHGLKLDSTGQQFERDVIFYCGGGWRSSVSFYFAWLVGIDNIRNYSDGWCGWSTRYERDPTATGSTPGWKQTPTGNPIVIHHR